MSSRKPTAIRCHEDPALFVEALNFTAADTGFAARLIEKDYFCSLVLDYLAGTDESLVRLVRKKLEVPANEPVDVSEERLTALRRQLVPQLRPVLRERGFREFDVDRAFRTVVEMANRLKVRARFSKRSTRWPTKSSRAQRPNKNQLYLARQTA